MPEFSGNNDISIRFYRAGTGWTNLPLTRNGDFCTPLPANEKPSLNSPHTIEFTSPRIQKKRDFIENNNQVIDINNKLLICSNLQQFATIGETAALYRGRAMGEKMVATTKKKSSKPSLGRKKMIWLKAKKKKTDSSTKSAPPIRLEFALLEEAKQHSSVHHRTVPQTIGMWATLGKQVEELLGAEAYAALATGRLAERISPKASAHVDFQRVLAALESDRASGQLAQIAADHAIWYEESHDMPGFLVRVNQATGRRDLGSFVDGAFKVNATATAKAGAAPSGKKAGVSKS